MKKGFRAVLAWHPRRYDRRIDPDTSLAEAITLVQTWAVHEGIALRGDATERPVVCLHGDDMPDPRCPASLVERATRLSSSAILVGAVIGFFRLAILTFHASGLAPSIIAATARPGVCEGSPVAAALLLLIWLRGARRTRYTVRLAPLITGQGQRIILRVRVSRSDSVSLARTDRLTAALSPSTGPINLSALEPRAGQVCAALTIVPPLAGWPPVRSHSSEPTCLAAYQADCVTWLAHLRREVESYDLGHAPHNEALAQTRASPAEQRLVAALRRAGLPIDTGCAIPTGSAHPDIHYACYWPDGAIRDTGAWLLVDVECDGQDHRDIKRRERDRRRDLRFRRRGWYVARVDLARATEHWPVAVASDLARLAQQHQEAVLAASQANRLVHALGSV